MILEVGSPCSKPYATRQPAIEREEFYQSENQKLLRTSVRVWVGVWEWCLRDYYNFHKYVMHAYA